MPRAATGLLCLSLLAMCAGGCGDDGPEARARTFLTAFQAGDAEAMRAQLSGHARQAELDRWLDEAAALEASEPSLKPAAYVRRRLFGSEQVRPDALHPVELGYQQGSSTAKVVFEYTLMVAGQARPYWGTLDLTRVNDDWFVTDYRYGLPDTGHGHGYDGPESSAWGFLTAFRLGDGVAMRALVTSPRLRDRIAGWEDAPEAEGDRIERVRRQLFGSSTHRPGRLEITVVDWEAPASRSEVRFEYTLPHEAGVEWLGGSLQMTRITDRWYVSDFTYGQPQPPVAVE